MNVEGYNQAVRVPVARAWVQVVEAAELDPRPSTLSPTKRSSSVSAASLESAMLVLLLLMLLMLMRAPTVYLDVLSALALHSAASRPLPLRGPRHRHLTPRLEGLQSLPSSSSPRPIAAGWTEMSQA